MAISTSFAATNSPESSATAINALGIDLLARTGKPNENALISPYSIQCGLAMAYAGADGVTKTEMAKALHYPPDEEELNHSFSALQQALEEIATQSAKQAEEMKQYAPRDPITLTVANRLFGQGGYDFRATFLSLVRTITMHPSNRLISFRTPQVQPKPSTHGSKTRPISGSGISSPKVR